MSMGVFVFIRIIGIIKDVPHQPGYHWWPPGCFCTSFGCVLERDGKSKMNLILSQSAFSDIKQECLRYPHLETGGILIGKCDSENVFVPFAIGSGTFARRSFARFKPDVEWQQERLDRYFEEYGINYVGSFHRHPGSLSRPSLIDYDTAVQILSDPEWAVNESVFPIILLRDGEVVIYPYYICRNHLKFEVMTAFMVPNNHVLLNQITEKDKSYESGNFRGSD